MKCLNPKCKKGEDGQPKEIPQPYKGRVKRYCCDTCRTQHWKTTNYVGKKRKSRDKIYLGVEEFKELIRKKEYGHIASKPMPQPLGATQTQPTQTTLTMPSHLTGIAAEFWRIKNGQTATNGSVH